jgi:hypothetical protein
MTRSLRRWLLSYGLTFAALSACAVWLAARTPSLREPPFDFLAMDPGEFVALAGLNRKQEGGLKIGFAETYAPPEIGLFGNHIVRYFGADAFGRPGDAELFFNYSYANLTLPETRQLLSHLEKLDRLPERLILVSVTPPNADNGHFIIDRGFEGFSDLVMEDVGAGPVGATLAAWHALLTELHAVFNYNTLALSLASSQAEERVGSEESCASGEDSDRARTWIDRLPWTVRRVVEWYRPDPCWYQDDYAILRDGRITSSEGGAPPLINQDPLDPEDRGLHAGDEAAIVRDLRAIDEIGRRSGAPVVFLVTPVYETDRSDSPVNRVLDRALERAPELVVIDDRGLHSDPSLFVDGIHPSARYYRGLVETLRERGLLDDGEDSLSAD